MSAFEQPRTDLAPMARDARRCASAGLFPGDRAYRGLLEQHNPFGRAPLCAAPGPAWTLASRVPMDMDGTDSLQRKPKDLSDDDVMEPLGSDRQDGVSNE